MLGLILVFTTGQEALGNIDGVSEAGNVVTSTSWGVTPSEQGGPAQAGEFTLTWPITSQPNAYHYFDGLNTGSQGLTNITFFAVNTPAVVNPRPTTIEFSLCRNGTWSSSTNLCSGTTVPLGNLINAATLTVVLTENLPEGGRLHIRAATADNRKSEYTTRISFQVSRVSVRAGSITNS
jgi:hypothetical protein